MMEANQKNFMQITISIYSSLAWPDRFFSARRLSIGNYKRLLRKRVWSHSHYLVVLDTSRVVVVLNSHAICKRLYRFISVMAECSEHLVREPLLSFEDALACTLTTLGVRELKSKQVIQNHVITIF